MKYNYYIIIISIFFSLKAFSQKREIRGVVSDGHVALKGVVVSLKEYKDKSSMSYCITNELGQFIIIDQKGCAKIIEAKMMGYSMQQIQLDQSTNNYNFVLEKKSFNLKEVVIKGTKIKGSGDTTRYISRAFASESDRTIGDVIKKMPGFNVTDNGRIKYFGKDISNLYIDGSNLMGTNYGVATNSLNYKNVASVEVIERHQPIKLFEDLMPSFDTSINLRLNENARNRLVGYLEAGGGLPSLFVCNLSVMRFAKKIKTFNTIKMNNVGDDIVSVLQKKDFGNSPQNHSIDEYISPKNLYAPFLDKRYTLFNHSYLFSSSNQVNLSKDIELLPQINFGYSRYTNSSEDKTIYLLPNSQQYMIEQEQDGWRKRLNLLPSITLNVNTNKVYLKNILSSSWDINKSDCEITGSHQNIEKTNLDNLDVKNELDVIFRAGKKVLSFKSINSYQTKSQHLNVVLSKNNIDEVINNSCFFSLTQLSQMYSFGHFSLAIDEGVRLYNQSLLSDIYSESPVSPNRQNSYKYKLTSFYVQPNLSLMYSNLKASLYLPSHFDSYCFIDLNREKKDSYQKRIIRFSPSFNFSWSISDKYSFLANAGYESKEQNPNIFYATPIISSYPYVLGGITNFIKDNKSYVGSTIRYKDILHSLFSNLTFSKSWNKSDLMSSQNFDNSMITTGYINKSYNSDLFLLMGDISYLFSFIKGGINLHGILSSSSTSYMQNGNLRMMESKIKEMTTSINVSPLAWMCAEYKFSLSNSILTPKDETGSALNNFNQTFSLILSKKNKMNVTITANHYNFKSDFLSEKNLFIFDTNLNYFFSSACQMSCSLKNILNQGIVNYISNSDTMVNITKYKLRPFSIWLTLTTTI